VTDKTATERVLSQLEALGVPRDAIVVDVVPAATLITNLQQYYRPLIGGLQISFGSSYCTLGVNVWYTNWAQGIGVGTPGFYTASHCSTTSAVTDGTVYLQGGTRIGFERFDPPFFTNAANTRCPVGYNCRWSDVAFAQYDSGTDGHHGAAAQTLYRGFNNWNPGSLDINSGSPEFTLNQTALPVVGQYMDKVGRTTGWTTGQVSRTCADYFVAGHYTLCQDQVEAYADGGDSGSPVFQWTGQTTAAFSGIVWAKTGTGAFVYSNLNMIANDMGSGVNYGPF
jgi:hypothetical protein